MGGAAAGGSALVAIRRGGAAGVFHGKQQKEPTFRGSCPVRSAAWPSTVLAPREPRATVCKCASAQCAQSRAVGWGGAGRTPRDAGPRQDVRVRARAVRQGGLHSHLRGTGPHRAGPGRAGQGSQGVTRHAVTLLPFRTPQFQLVTKASQASYPAIASGRRAGLHQNKHCYGISPRDSDKTTQLSYVVSEQESRGDIMTTAASLP